MKKLLLLTVALVLAVTAAFGEMMTAVESPATATGLAEEAASGETFLVTTEDGSWPELNAQGYLDAGEFVYENPDEGVWRYCSSTLKVEIIRQNSTRPNRIWYEAEVWSISEIWDLVQAVPGKYVSEVDFQPAIASRNGCVLALNADEANYRWSKQGKGIGVLVRNHQILWDKHPKEGYKGFPTLDNLVLYDDGRMEVYDVAEKEAQDFIDMGARHVLAFGPYLVRDGVLNEKRCRAFDASNGVARIAVGQIGEGHYMAVMCEGRHKGSKGCNLWWMAQKMAEKGCVTAFNLDGGRTASIEFMGKQICTVGASPFKDGSARKSAELLYIGRSTLVEGYDPAT